MDPTIYDSLTGLSGVALFSGQLDRAYRRELAGERGLAVLALGVPQVDWLRRQYGDAFVDLGLVGVSRALSESLRRVDRTAHLGDGRFLAFASHLRSPGDATRLAQRVHDRVRWVFRLEGNVERVPVRLGMSLRIPCERNSLAALLIEEAMRALFDASDEGVHLFGAGRLTLVPTAAAAAPGSATDRRWTDHESPPALA
ncbi:MAG TPA: GGDEF domain-containing protein [Dehalococcoidia bacterium]|nr:GGDEF domain-containing protein [Dehalococcoidia bacterium]